MEIKVLFCICNLEYMSVFNCVPYFSKSMSRNGKCVLDFSIVNLISWCKLFIKS